MSRSLSWRSCEPATTTNPIAGMAPAQVSAGQQRGEGAETS